MDSRRKRLIICSSAAYRAGQANAIAQFEDGNLRERGQAGLTEIFLSSIRDIRSLVVLRTRHLPWFLGPLSKLCFLRAGAKDGDRYTITHTDEKFENARRCCGFQEIVHWHEGAHSSIYYVTPNGVRPKLGETELRCIQWVSIMSGEGGADTLMIEPLATGGSAARAVGGLWRLAAGRTRPVISNALGSPDD